MIQSLLFFRFDSEKETEKGARRRAVIVKFNTRPESRPPAPNMPSKVKKINWTDGITLFEPKWGGAPASLATEFDARQNPPVDADRAFSLFFDAVEARQVYKLDLFIARAAPDLLRRCLTEPRRVGGRMHTILTFAATVGDSFVVKRLLNEPIVDPEARPDSDGRTAFALAVRSGNVDLATAFLTHYGPDGRSIDYNPRDAQELTPFLACCTNPETSAQMLKLLLKHRNKVDIFAPDRNGRSGYVLGGSMVGYLIQKCVSQQDIWRMTPDASGKTDREPRPLEARSEAVPNRPMGQEPIGRAMPENPSLVRVTERRASQPALGTKRPPPDPTIEPGTNSRSSIERELVLMFPDRSETQVLDRRYRRTRTR